MTWPITIEEDEVRGCRDAPENKKTAIRLFNCFQFAKFVKTKSKTDDFDPFYAGMVVAQAFLS